MSILNSPQKPRRTARSVALAATVLASTLVLAACSSVAPASVTKTAGPDTGKEIDAITVALPGSLSNLYPGQEAGILNYYLASAVQEGLVSVDASGKVQPALAESWVQPDPASYVFTLRADARFQDGTPVTVDDVIYSIRQAQDATVSPSISYAFAGVTGLERTATNQLTITLAAPDAAFLRNLSTAGALFVSSKAFLEAHAGTVGTKGGLILGSGPYKVASFSPDTGVELERVDTWWGGTPKIKTIHVSFIPDEDTRLLAAKSGTTDLSFNVPLAQSGQWEGLDTQRVQYVNDLSYVGLNFDTTLAPFDDVHVRRAISESIDRDTIVSTLLKGHGRVATAIPTPESLGESYGAADATALLAALPQNSFDLDAAKAELAKSAHPDGFTAEILYPNTGPQLGNAAQSLAENLGKIGITLTVTEVPIEQWLASIGDGVHGLGFTWYFSTTGDPGEVTNYLLGAGNSSHYTNPAIVDVLAQAQASTDASKRIDLLLKANTLQSADVVDAPLWWGQSATSFATDLGISDYSSFAFTSPWPSLLYSAGEVK